MRARRLVDARSLTAVLAAAALGLPASAAAHGGITVAQGGSGGVRILVQGTEAAAADGSAAADLSTTLDGAGSGAGARVVYWIRPKGRERAFRVRTERDERGIHHAEIRTADRGSWQDWDVAAYVTLSTGRELRVTNDRRDPPGPPEAPASGGTPPPTTTTEAAPPAGAGTTTDAAPADDASSAVEDVSGEGDGTPGWVVPSIVVLVVLGVVAVVLRQRRLPPDPRD
ncbi:hypothetical protein SK069_12920 [Patulibacter brassicae]|uniref:Uncharacterized protein n=1 Tax=Patulibacter brassicae TaxID=1705717 RepID=A0ABU4VKX1_9ACTN|nr:hypothetical protein [Patulibacter brassicae]MDX8152501.1 hypothetical protein [Patulibacter brassicae]